MNRGFTLIELVVVITIPGDQRLLPRFVHDFVTLIRNDARAESRATRRGSSCSRSQTMRRNAQSLSFDSCMPA